MKYRCFAALALALLLPGCAAAPDLTPVWQRDLPASGVHIELANAALLSDADGASPAPAPLGQQGGQAGLPGALHAKAVLIAHG